MEDLFEDWFPALHVAYDLKIYQQILNLLSVTDQTDILARFPNDPPPSLTVIRIADYDDDNGNRWVWEYDQRDIPMLSFGQPHLTSESRWLLFFSSVRSIVPRYPIVEHFFYVNDPDMLNIITYLHQHNVPVYDGFMEDPTDILLTLTPDLENLRLLDPYLNENIPLKQIPSEVWDQIRSNPEIGPSEIIRYSYSRLYYYNS